MYVYVNCLKFTNTKTMNLIQFPQKTSGTQHPINVTYINKDNSCRELGYFSKYSDKINSKVILFYCRKRCCKNTVTVLS